MVGVKTEGRGAINAQIRFNRNEGSGGNHGRPIWRSNTLCSRLENEGHAIWMVHGTKRESACQPAEKTKFFVVVSKRTAYCI